jgi:hypothetical protein
MTLQEQANVTKALGTLAVVLGEDISGDRLEAYLAVLDDLNGAAIERAVGALAKTARFFPKPAEIRELIVGAPGDTALKAWTDLQCAYRRAGYWTSVLFEDGAIAAAVEYVFGTWALCSEQLNLLSPEMLRAKQKEFFDAYRRAVREGKTSPKYLRGFCEIQNLETVGKWERGQPVTIGDRTIFTQLIFVQDAANGRTVEAEFDFYSGAMLTPLTELAQRPGVRALPPATETKMLSAGAGEPVDPQEGRQVIADSVRDLVGLMKMPQLREGLTDEQWEARRIELKRQAEQI